MGLIDYGNNAVYWTSASQLINLDNILFQSHQSSLTCLLWNESLWAQRCHIPLGVWESSTCPTSAAPTVLWAAGKPATCSKDLPGNGFAHRLVPIALELLQQGSLWIGFDHLGFGVKENLGIDICQDMFHVFQNPGAVIFGRTCTKLYLGFAYKCSLCPSDCFCTVGNASRAQATALIRFFGNEL